MNKICFYRIEVNCGIQDRFSDNSKNKIEKYLINIPTCNLEMLSSTLTKSSISNSFILILDIL